MVYFTVLKTCSSKNNHLKEQRARVGKYIVIHMPFSILLLLLSHFSRVRLCATPYTAAHQAPPVPESLQARILEWVAISFANA